MSGEPGRHVELDGYEIQALLGFGATGEVWRARELATGDTVALKRLRADADPDAVDLLRREASLLRTLDTPYVVRLRAVLGGDEDVVLVLDHAAGGSLAALLTRRGCLGAGEVVTVAGPLASALEAAHRVGLVHGDVSPANVLFTADGMPLLSDLGVAYTAGEHRPHVEGTAEYADPAVVAGADPDEAADVWALAAVCHHMLAGSPPHDGENTDAVLLAAARGGRAPLGLLTPTAPRALVEAIEAGLADRADRPDAAAFASLLRRSHGAAPVQLAGTATSAMMPEPRETTVLRSWSGGTEPAGARGRWSLPAWAGVTGRHGGTGGRALEQPVAATGSGSRQRPAGSSRGRGWIVAGAAVLLVAAAVAGWASGRVGDDGAMARAPLPAIAGTAATPTAGTLSSGIPSSASAGGADAQARFRTVVRSLDTARAEAFAAGDKRLLAGVAAPGSTALRTDQALLAELRTAGSTAHGLRHEIRSVQVLSDSAEQVRVRVRDVLPSYELRARDGSVLAQVAGRGEREHVLTLVRKANGWRLWSVTPL